MTSNLGSAHLLEGIDENGDINPEAEELVMNELRGHFRPEFLNRLDEIIMFKPLTKDNIGNIIHLLMNQLEQTSGRPRDFRRTYTGSRELYRRAWV